MASWIGIAVARTAPGSDEMLSRLSTYLHPLAGRPLSWHTVTALASLQPAPDRLYLIGGPELQPEIFGESAVAVETLTRRPDGPPVQPPALEGSVLLADAAAPTVGPALSRLLREPDGTAVPGSKEGTVAAARLAAPEAHELLASLDPLAELAGQRSRLRWLEPSPEALVVHDRVSLAQAARAVRDRIVERLMQEGVTFLLPDSVLVDVDVRIGRDSIVYPGVVLEGHTAIGEETVVGPGCRIIDSWVGSGVELKGWNFVSRTSIRNRAILEPYVRRGFD